MGKKQKNDRKTNNRIQTQHRKQQTNQHELQNTGMIKCALDGLADPHVICLWSN